MTAEVIQRNYERKIWSVAQVKVAVKAGVITPAQFAEITGQEYKG